MSKPLAARIIQAWLYLHGKLPLGYHRWWGRVLGWLLCHVFHYRVHVVMTNLARAFPEKKYQELKAISRQFYTHLATVFTEMIWFGACRGQKGRKRLHDSHIVEITNPEELSRLCRSARQLMLLQAHTGNWELIGGILNYSYGQALDIDPSRFAVTYHRLASECWDAVMAWNRTAPVADLGFEGYVETMNMLRFAIGHKEEPYGYSFITDQFPYVYSWGTNVEFLHQSTRTMTGAAALACKLNMAVGYLRFRCREDGGYTLTVVPIGPPETPMQPEELMKRYYELLEEDLRQQPWNYLWTHKRWK